MADEPTYRLPRTVIPRRYELEIEPDLTAGTFRGTVVTQVDVLEPVTAFDLNAAHLVLGEPVLRGPAGTACVGTVAYRPDDEQVTVTWPVSVTPGDWTFSTSFEGRLADDLRGFYRTTVTDREGRTYTIAATQCEATDARRIFPCWDEPDFKARFAVTLVVDAHLTALSNGPEVATEHIGDKKRVRFAETIPLSTYLVALAVGPFEGTDPVSVDGVPVRIVARPGFRHLTTVAAEAAVDTLRFYRDYFGIPCPAPKMDHIAIPDFAAGAMENLGLVTYREEALLLDADKASPRERMWVVGVIAHETAHMWFGDLVTMRWWNGLWLNEAFATFMQTLCTDALHPEWDVWTSYGPQKAYALSVDGLASTRPIEYPVGPPAEAWGMFDALTYEKGGSVLRMLEQYLGPEVFRQGVRHYLTRHRYGNTETSDLWAALEEVSGQPVRAAMDSWVFQGGYPMVLAGVDPEGRALRLVQRPFRYMGDGEGRWQVPVVIGVRRESGGEHRIELLLGADEARIDLPADWTVVVVNRGGWGFYRVAYDDALWSRMLPAWPTLTGLERHGLVDDTWAAALANRGSLERAVTLWGMLDGDRDPDVWAEALRQWRLLDYMIDDRGRDALGRLVRQVGRPWLARLTWDPAPGEDMRTSRLRATVIQALGTIGQDLEVREEALRRFHEHLQGRRVIAGSLLTEVTVLAAAAGGASEWELIYRGFKDPKTPQDLTRNLTALAAFRRPELLARTLDVYFSDAVRVQDGAIAIGAALRNRYAQAETWTRIERQWDDLLAKYPPSMMQHILEPIATIVTDALADRTIAWVDAHPIPEVARMVAQAKDMQAVHRAFAKRLGHTVPVLLTP